MLKTWNTRLTIAWTIILFGLVTMGCLGLALAISIGGLRAVGIGGSNYDRVISGKDLVADILPPPLYVLEAYLEATLILQQNGDPAVHADHLRQLHKDFDDRRRYWMSSSLPDELKAALERETSAADQFWTELETIYLPSVGRTETSVLAQSFGRLSTQYAQHRSAVDDLVLKANAFATDVEANAKTQTRYLISVMMGLGVIVSLVIASALVLVSKRVVVPIVSVAAKMQEMAQFALRREAETKAQTSLDKNLMALRDSLSALGHPRREGNQLYFGSVLINGNDDLVDRVRAQFGGVATIFLDDVRIATNVLSNDGTRAIGTKLSAEAARHAVFTKKQMFRGSARILDQDYISVYEPIMIGSEVIGIIFVGVHTEEVRLDEKLTSAVETRNEVILMQTAIQTLETAMHSKDRAEIEAMEQRYQSADALRRATALNRTVAAGQELVVVSLSHGLESLAARDLTHDLDIEFPQEYRQLKTNFLSAVTTLHDTIVTISDQAKTIFGVSEQISQAADDLSSRTEQQAANLEETAAALDGITNAVQSTAAGAAHAQRVAASAREHAEQSSNVVREAVVAMDGIQRSSQEIAQIISVIDEIAFQVNLLALNAGVEAARAGDAGRGFAVVASEVRALAQRSAGAAKEIKALISRSSTQVEQGVKLVSDTGAVLEQILSQVSEISTVIVGIADSTGNQAAGLAEVNVAVKQMDRFTQQNAALVGESAVSSQSLAQEAKQLTRLINRFHVGGDAAAAPSDTDWSHTAWRESPSHHDAAA